VRSRHRKLCVGSREWLRNRDSSTVDVMRLSDWSCMSTDSTDISVRVPKVGDKDVRISLNKWEGLWSAPSLLEIRFPVIVH
jgi:hypothetical protein